HGVVAFEQGRNPPRFRRLFEGDGCAVPVPEDDEFWRRYRPLEPDQGPGGIEEGGAGTKARAMALWLSRARPRGWRALRKEKVGPGLKRSARPRGEAVGGVGGKCGPMGGIPGLVPRIEHAGVAAPNRLGEKADDGIAAVPSPRVGRG